MTSHDDRGEPRNERIARIRREIAAGTYETPEKLSRALDAFLDHPRFPAKSGNSREK
jgi:hypothetical protein